MTIKDGDWELIDYDFASGRSVWRYFDGKATHIRTDTPVDATIDQNKEARNIARTDWAGDYHMIASVPQNVAWSSGLVEAFSGRDDRFISKFLNDSDNRAWRTKEGRV